MLAMILVVLGSALVLLAVVLCASELGRAAVEFDIEMPDSF